MSLYPLGIALMRAITAIAFRVRIEGTEHLRREDGFIIASNHVSGYDPVFLSLAAYRVKKRINYMAKEELIKIPLIGRVLRALGAFPVRRGMGDRGALDTAAKIVTDGKIFGIFPEGTRSKTGKLLPGKSGVAVISARTRCDVVPASIYIEGAKLRWLTKVTVRVGKPIAFEQLGLSEDFTTPELRAASALIMQQIGEQYNKGTLVKA